jgi:hypothetical protein
MKRFKLEQSNADIIIHSGLALVGQAIKRYTRLSTALDTKVLLQHGIRHSDVVKSYLALLSTRKNDFEAINNIDSEFYLKHAMSVNKPPCEATLRQRMDKNANAFLPILKTASVDFLTYINPTLIPTSSGHIPIDADVTPMDHSSSHKEGVSRTYNGHYGFAPMAVNIGQEGYCLDFEFREGKQHFQKDTPALLNDRLHHARRITTQPLLLRLDGGNDSIENIDVVLKHNLQYPDQTDVGFLIKWNPRRQDKRDWLEQAEQQANWIYPREGKRVGVHSIKTTRHWQGYDYKIRQVIRVIERTIEKHGQSLLILDIKLEGWWTSLDLEEPAIIQLYCDHGTSEQFHSEFKTDLDIERPPSGKFVTNALVLTSSVLIYNILRWIGQTALTGSRAPKGN